jgi:hypothetical protein
VDKSDDELCYCQFCSGKAVGTDSHPFVCCVKDFPSDYDEESDEEEKKPLRIKVAKSDKPEPKREVIFPLFILF